MGEDHLSGIPLPQMQEIVEFGGGWEGANSVLTHHYNSQLFSRSLSASISSLESVTPLPSFS